MLSSVQLGTEAGGARCSARTAPRKGKKTHSISPRGLEGADEAERSRKGRIRAWKQQAEMQLDCTMAPTCPSPGQKTPDLAPAHPRVP